MHGVYLEHSGEDRGLRSAEKVVLVIRSVTLYKELLTARGNHEDWQATE